MTKEAAEPVADEPQFVDSGLHVPEAPLSVTEATVPQAPRNQQRGRGPGRPPRFRQTAVAGSGSGNPASAPPLNLEPVPVQPPLSEISGETTSASTSGIEPLVTAERKERVTATTSKTPSGKTGRHSRPARPNRSSGNKKKPT